MKQYYCKESDEMIEFGDIIRLTFCKDFDNGKVVVEKEIPFTENTMDYLIEMGFVEEREDTEETPNDEPTFTQEIKALKTELNDLQKKVHHLEKFTTNIHKTVKKLVDNLIQEKTAKTDKLK